MGSPLFQTPISTYQGSVHPLEQQIITSQDNDINRKDSTPVDSEKKTIGDLSQVLISDSELDDALEEAKALDKPQLKNHSSAQQLGLLVQKNKEEKYKEDY